MILALLFVSFTRYYSCCPGCCGQGIIPEVAAFKFFTDSISLTVTLAPSLFDALLLNSSDQSCTAPSFQIQV